MKQIKLKIKYIKENYLLILGITASILAILYIIFQFKIQNPSVSTITKGIDYLDYYSKIGDAIGGFAGSLLTFASILFVLHTIKIQREEINTQKKELHYQRKEYIENKLLTIIYKEHDRWYKICENKKIRLELLIKPYLPTSTSYSSIIVKSNYSELNKNENLELIEEYNKICFRLYTILFNENSNDSNSPTQIFDRNEIKDFLYIIGSLFETTKIYAFYDTLLCSTPNDKKNLKLSAELDILKNKMHYIRCLNFKIFEYQNSNLPVKENEKSKIIYDTSNERLFAFFQIDAIGNKVNKLREENNKMPAANIV